jgi:hypothetical protein
MRLLILPLLALPLLAAPRDWRSAPAVVEIDTAADVFAMGDVHGDDERMLQLLTGAGVIDGRHSWQAGRAVLVVTGDMIDKGPNALGVLAFLRKLAPQAAQAGGRVVVLMGNHEAEFLAHPGAAKSRDFAGELSRAGLKPAEVAACRGDLGGFLCDLPFAARVNDWFFSHAGNTAGRSLARLTADLEAGVDRDGFRTAQLIGDDSLLEARIGEKSADGRSWFERGSLDAYTAALGVHHIVEGHHHGAARFADGAVRYVGEMFDWRGELFLIDTGMSREIGDSSGALLHIRSAQQEAAAVCPGGRETILWSAKQPAKSGKAAPCRPAGR